MFKFYLFICEHNIAVLSMQTIYNTMCKLRKYLIRCLRCGTAYKKCEHIR